MLHTCHIASFVTRWPNSGQMMKYSVQLDIQDYLIISKSKGMEKYFEFSKVQHKQMVASSKCKVLVQF